MNQPIFALLTDFGYDFAVGSLKALLYSALPNALVIDFDHTCPQFQPIAGSFILEKAHAFFPPETIFICIVDPGVGTPREPLLITTPSYTFIGPNNGLFTSIYKLYKTQPYIIEESLYLKNKSVTFHGRDLFVPAAIDFYKNNTHQFKPIDQNKLMSISEQIDPHITTIVYIDSFGNIKTNKELTEKNTPYNSMLLTIDNKQYTIPFARTFEHAKIGDLLAYRGSNNTLEIAVNRGSAAAYLNMQVGANIHIHLQQ